MKGVIAYVIDREENHVIRITSEDGKKSFYKFKVWPTFPYQAVTDVFHQWLIRGTFIAVEFADNTQAKKFYDAVMLNRKDSKGIDASIAVPKPKKQNAEKIAQKYSESAKENGLPEQVGDVLARIDSKVLKPEDLADPTTAAIVAEELDNVATAKELHRMDKENARRMGVKKDESKPKSQVPGWVDRHKAATHTAIKKGAPPIPPRPGQKGGSADAALATENANLRQLNQDLHNELEKLKTELARERARRAQLEKVLKQRGMHVKKPKRARNPRRRRSPHTQRRRRSLSPGRRLPPSPNQKEQVKSAPQETKTAETTTTTAPPAPPGPPPPAPEKLQISGRITAAALQNATLKPASERKDPEAWAVPKSERSQATLADLISQRIEERRRDLNIEEESEEDSWDEFE